MTHDKIENITEAFSEVHTPCRIEFLSNSQHASSKYRHKQATYETLERGYGEIQEENSMSFTRLKLSLTGNIICFVCNTKRNVDNNQYKLGGVARCSLEATAKKLMQKKQFYLKEKNHRFYEVLQFYETGVRFRNSTKIYSLYHYFKRNIIFYFA